MEPKIKTSASIHLFFYKILIASFLKRHKSNLHSATIAIEQFSGTILNNQEIIVRQYYN